MSSHPEDTRSSPNWPNDTCILLACNNISPPHRTDEEVKGHLIWESEVYNCFGADLTFVNDFREPGVFCKYVQISLTGFPNCTLPLAVTYTSSVMDARGTDTNDLRAALPAVADSSSHSMSRTAMTAFVQGITELGPTVNASALVPRIESSGEKERGQATGGLEVAAVTSSSEGLDIQGEKDPTTQTTAGGGPKSRTTKRQAGDRSRFRPWGYI